MSALLEGMDSSPQHDAPLPEPPRRKAGPFEGMSKLFEKAFERTIEHPFDEAAEGFLQKAGFIEVLPEEEPIREELRFAALMAANVLRGNVDLALPQGVDHSSDIDTVILDQLSDYCMTEDDQFLSGVVEYICTNPPLSSADTADVRTVIKGIIRRQTAIAGRRGKLHLVCADIYANASLRDLLAVLVYESGKIIQQKRLAGQEEREAFKDKRVLVLTHLGRFNANGFASQVKHNEKRSKAEKRKAGMKGMIGDLAARTVSSTRLGKTAFEAFNAATGCLSMVHLGTAVVFSELRQAGMQGPVDYVDLADSHRIEDILAKEPREYDVVLISATSYDVEKVQDFAPKFREAGMQVIVGGVSASLDPAGLRKAGVTIFSGEIEDAGGAIRYLVDRHCTKVHIHREPIPEELLGTAKLKRIKGVGMCYKVKSNKYRHLYIGALDARVNMGTTYETKKEKESCQLRWRMESLLHMLPYATVNGRTYETSATKNVHVISMVRGCPEVCDMCSTVDTEGQRMRRRSVESIEQELSMVETNVIVDIGQNVFARGTDEKGEKEDKWLNYWYDVFTVFAGHGKKLAVQTELASIQHLVMGGRRKVKEGRDLIGNAKYLVDFNGSAQRMRDRGQQLIDRWQGFDQLISKVVFAALCGLEQPVKIAGAGDKRPELFQEQLKLARELGIPILGTIVAGMPPELLNLPKERMGEALLFSPLENMPEDEYEDLKKRWMSWIENLEVYAVMWLPFTAILGARGYHKLTDQTREGGALIEDGKQGYLQNEGIKGHRIQGVRMAKDLIREYYSLRRSTMRLLQASRHFGSKRLLFLSLLNGAFTMVESLGVDPGRSIAKMTE
ncbi:hypothetical protein AUK40_06025 [Candidatus Wirthbacteria bacterium CG2_30_54_11]|uniref:B12-binding domain-containing protein n=1 Tax=Candidatus Wirthbacteria bacterium CG2_30_54_11 TaxID=1817892 RepID=A0A1J5IM15_9BACT|nr:MAG: hypothetical protein AUK40_06025 [Candidatus Wirthbacteria bacterium CG2_30_54_11]